MKAGLELSSGLFDFDARSRLWVLSTGGNLRCLDLEHGTLAKRHTLVAIEGVDSMAISPAGDRLLLVDRVGCRLLEEPLASGPSLPTPFEGIAAGRFTADGERLLLAHCSEGVLLAGVEGLRLEWAWSYDRAVLEPRLFSSSDSLRVGVLCAEDVVLLHAGTGELDAEIGLGERTIESASPDAALSKWALAMDGGKCLYRAERVEGDRFRYEALEHKSIRIRALASAPGGLVLAQRSATGALWWLDGEGEVMRLLKEHERVDELVVSPDGRHLAVRSGVRLGVYRLSPSASRP